MYYFYILLSTKDNGYYYGSTSDLKRRVAEHHKGQVAATSYRRPVALVYYEAFQTISAARNREQQVKKSSSIRASLHKRLNS